MLRSPAQRRSCMPTLKIAELNQQLEYGAARWQARQTPHSLFTDEQKRRLLGVEVDHAQLAAAMSMKASVEPPAFDPIVDWRNRGGNHVTSIKDQKQCGSCVSFCTVSVTEAMASIEKGQLLDLSEADLHFCSSHGASCGGWNQTDGFNQIKSRGVCDDAAFPYPTAFPGNDIWGSPPSCHVPA